MPKPLQHLAATLLALALAGAACTQPAPSPTSTPAPPPVTPSPTPWGTWPGDVMMILDYTHMPYDQVINASSAIVVGDVLAISPTRANQDSGEYWGGALPVFTLEVEVLRAIVDNISLSNPLTITQVGYSPLEHGASAPLAVGQRAVFFVVERDIAWLGGVRPVFRTTNTIEDSIIVVGEGGPAANSPQEAARIDEIVEDIASLREVIPSPTPD